MGLVNARVVFLVFCFKVFPPVFEYVSHCRRSSKRFQLFLVCFDYGFWALGFLDCSLFHFTSCRPIASCCFVYGFRLNFGPPGFTRFFLTVFCVCCLLRLHKCLFQRGAMICGMVGQYSWGCGDLCFSPWQLCSLLGVIMAQGEQTSSGLLAFYFWPTQMCVLGF